MALIVKYPYAEALLAEMVRQPGMGDDEFLAHVNAERPTGAVEVVAVEPSMGDFLVAFNGAKDFADAQVRLAALATTEERPVMGPSIAAECGLGVMDDEMVKQLRSYDKLDEAAVRAKLADVLTAATAEVRR